MTIKQFVREFLEREYSLPGNIDFEKFNYVESGYVDSIGLIQFIATIEDEYDIEFSDKDLLNPEIRVVDGLIKLIESKLKDK